MLRCRGSSRCTNVKILCYGSVSTSTIIHQLSPFNYNRNDCFPFPIIRESFERKIIYWKDRKFENNDDLSCVPYNGTYLYPNSSNTLHQKSVHKYKIVYFVCVCVSWSHIYPRHLHTFFYVIQFIKSDLLNHQPFILSNFLLIHSYLSFNFNNTHHYIIL